MTAQAKRHWGEAMTWIFRALTAVGAFFLIEIYNEVKATRQDVNEALRQNGANEITDRFQDVRIDSHERRLNHLQNID